VDAIRDAGFPADRISCINNTIDMSGFESALDSITSEERAATRQRLGIAPDAPVALYCGSLYPEKRLDTLVAACELVVRTFPTFVLLVVGDGPERARLEAVAEGRSWIRILGAQRGREKAGLFRAADLVVHPGALGLIVLDAFCAGLPLVTMRGSLHGPELAYLADGKNGLIAEDDVRGYASTVRRLLLDPALRRRLGDGARDSSRQYTLEAMVAQFADGARRCLALRR
jgi:glycosyltransferase involved in cell wall biosynthesis